MSLQWVRICLPADLWSDYRHLAFFTAKDASVSSLGFDIIHRLMRIILSSVQSSFEYSAVRSNYFKKQLIKTRTICTPRRTGHINFFQQRTWVAYLWLKIKIDWLKISIVMIIIRVYSIWMGNKSLLAFLVIWLSVSSIPQAIYSSVCYKCSRCRR